MSVASLPSAGWMCWNDLGWLPDAHQADVSLLLRTGGKNEIKNLWAERRTGRSLVNFCQVQNRLSLGKINLLQISNRVGQWEIRAKLKTSSSHCLFFFPGSTSLLNSLPPPLQAAQENDGCDQFITSWLCSSSHALVCGSSHKTQSSMSCSAWVSHGPQLLQEPDPVWPLHKLQLPSRHIHLLQCRILHGMWVDICCTMDL